MVDAAGIGIPASCISVRYGRIPYQTGSGIGILFIPVPAWPDAGQSDIPAFKKGVLILFITLPELPDAGQATFRHLKKGYTLHFHTAIGLKAYTL